MKSSMPADAAARRPARPASGRRGRPSPAETARRGGWARACRRKQPSSGSSRIASAMKASENCTTRLRSGTSSPGGTSLTQLCGRFGPVSTRLPGSKLADEVADEIAAGGGDDVVDLVLGMEVPADRAERIAVLPGLERFLPADVDDLEIRVHGSSPGSELRPTARPRRFPRSRGPTLVSAEAAPLLRFRPQSDIFLTFRRESGGAAARKPRAAPRSRDPLVLGRPKEPCGAGLSFRGTRG